VPDLANDCELEHKVTRSFGIMEEVVGHIGDKLKSEYPELLNRVIHQYFKVGYVIIYKTTLRKCQR
jgi:uncharacterized protein with HEPN domain